MNGVGGDDVNKISKIFAFESFLCQVSPFPHFSSDPIYYSPYLSGRVLHLSAARPPGQSYLATYRKPPVRNYLSYDILPIYPNLTTSTLTLHDALWKAVRSEASLEIKSDHIGGLLSLFTMAYPVPLLRQDEGKQKMPTPTDQPILAISQCCC